MADNSIRLKCPCCGAIARVTSSRTRLVCYDCLYRMLDDAKIEGIMKGNFSINSYNVRLQLTKDLMRGIN